MPDDTTANVLIAGSFTKADAAHLAYKLDAQPSEDEPYIAFFVGASGVPRLCLTERCNSEFFLHAAYAQRRGARFAEVAHGPDGKALGRRPSLSGVVGMGKRPTTGDSLRHFTRPWRSAQSALSVEQRTAEREFGLVVLARCRLAAHSALRRLE
jgi:hypothetical protein